MILDHPSIIFPNTLYSTLARSISKQTFSLQQLSTFASTSVPQYTSQNMREKLSLSVGVLKLDLKSMSWENYKHCKPRGLKKQTTKTN